MYQMDTNPSKFLSISNMIRAAELSLQVQGGLEYQKKCFWYLIVLAEKFENVQNKSLSLDVLKYLK